MRKPNGRELKALFILSIAVPVSLLATFRLTGILKEPITITEIITLETVSWEFEPILRSTDIRDIRESTYSNGQISLVQSVFIDDFSAEYLTFGGSDTLSISVNITGTANNGYIYEVHLSFLEDYENSKVDLFLDLQSLVKLNNLSIINYQHWLRGNLKAFFETRNVNRSASVYLYLPAHWVLRSVNLRNQTRLLEITSEVTYFNGTVYKKIIQPFQLLIRPDDNDSFDTAYPVGSGTYGLDPMLWLGTYYDREDFYKTCLYDSWYIEVTMTPPFGQDFDLYLYSPTERTNPVKRSEKRGDAEESISYKLSPTDPEGDWFIKVSQVGGWGFYTMTVWIKKPAVQAVPTSPFGMEPNT